MSPDSETLDRDIRDHRGQLAKLARRQGLSAEDALDCVHDAFCTFIEQSTRFEPPSSRQGRAAVLASIVVNTARNKRRRHHLSRPHRQLDSVEEPDSGPSSEALLANAEDHVRLQGCVSRLCESQRTVVMMRLLEERPGQDVASELGLTRG